MGLFDFINVGLAASGQKGIQAWGDLLGGKYGVELGQSLSGYLISGRQTHILGQELKLCIDPESFFTPASAGLMAVMSLLLGATGKSELYFGRNMGSTYIGPKFDIKRVPHSFEKRVETTALAGLFTAKDPSKDPVDAAACVACSALSLITMGVSVGLDIASKILYGDGKSPKDQFYLVNSLSLALTSRLMALMELIEIKCGWVSMGTYFIYAGKLLVKIAAVLLTVPIVMAAGLVDVCALGTANALEATISAGEALMSW